MFRGERWKQFLFETEMKTYFVCFSFNVIPKNELAVTKLANPLDPKEEKQKWKVLAPKWTVTSGHIRKQIKSLDYS